MEGRPCSARLTLSQGRRARSNVQLRFPPGVNMDARRFHRHPLIVSIAFGVLLGIAGLALVLILPSSSPSRGRPSHHAAAVTPTSITPAGPVAVPNVKGLLPAEAAGVLQANGITNSIANLNCSNLEVGRGRVVRQTPAPGSRVAYGSRISLQISCT